MLHKRCNQKQYRRRPPPIKNHRIKWHVGVVHQHKVWIRHNDLIQINHSLYCTHSFQFWHVQNLSLLYVNRANQEQTQFPFSWKEENNLLVMEKTWLKIEICHRLSMKIEIYIKSSDNNSKLSWSQYDKTLSSFYHKNIFL